MSKSQKVLRTIVITIILILGGMCLANASTPPPKRTVKQGTTKKVSDIRKVLVPAHILILYGGRKPKTYNC